MEYQVVVRVVQPRKSHWIERITPYGAPALCGISVYPGSMWRVLEQDKPECKRCLAIGKAIAVQTRR